MDTIGVTGGDVGHTNIQPSLVLNFCIAVEGIYPQRP
jgi:microcystin-dependent protein